MNAETKIRTQVPFARADRAGDPDIPAGYLAYRGACARIVAVLVQAALAATLAAPTFAQDERTVAALQIAYHRECNSRLHYGAYAARADRQGDWMAAAAFRAAAVGESVHAAIHAHQLERLGVEPRWTIESVVVRSTAENLQTSIENEAHEAECIYPELRRQCEAECQYDALTTLRYARGAEATHAELFTLVLLALQTQPATGGNRLATLEPARLGVFLVCIGDGRVFTRRPDGRCPGCGYGAGHERSIPFAWPDPEPAGQRALALGR